MSSTLSQWRPYKLNFILRKIKGNLIWWRQSALNEDCVWVVEKHYISVSYVVAYNSTMTWSTFNVHPHPSALCPGPGYRGSSLSRKADKLPIWLNSTQLESTQLSFMLFFHYNWVPTLMCVVVVIQKSWMSFVSNTNTPKQWRTWRRWYTWCSVHSFLWDRVFLCVVFCAAISLIARL